MGQPRASSSQCDFIHVALLTVALGKTVVSASDWRGPQPHEAKRRLDLLPACREVSVHFDPTTYVAKNHVLRSVLQYCCGVQRSKWRMLAPAEVVARKAAATTRKRRAGSPWEIKLESREGVLAFLTRVRRSYDEGIRIMRKRRRAGD